MREYWSLFTNAVFECSRVLHSKIHSNEDFKMKKHVLDLSLKLAGLLSSTGQLFITFMILSHQGVSSARLRPCFLISVAGRVLSTEYVCWMNAWMLNKGIYSIHIFYILCLIKCGIFCMMFYNLLLTLTFYYKFCLTSLLIFKRVYFNGCIVFQRDVALWFIESVL